MRMMQRFPWLKQPRDFSGWLGALTLVGSLVVATVVVVLRLSFRDAEQDRTDVITNSERIRFACLGNSIQYFNDSPRLLEHMLRTRFRSVVQDSCLRGGANIESLWRKGNGMSKKFRSPAALKEDGTHDIGSPTVQTLLGNDKIWDFVIINDHTQRPARVESRMKSIEALKDDYADLLRGSVTIFIQTAAYRVQDIKESSDLGTFEEFTMKVERGYEEYVETMSSMMLPSRLAHWGRAYAVVRERNRELFDKLYASDDFHPSPLGTWLQACVLYCTMVGEEPPSYNSTWWETARYMADEEPPLPSETEAEELKQVACQVCGL